MSDKRVRKRRRGSVAHAKAPSDWIDRELSECTFKDERLAQRFRSLFEQLSTGPGESIPLVCQDWANTKAAYRFLDNERVSEAEILAGHFQATRERFAATSGPILVLHGTTEFSYCSLIPRAAYTSATARATSTSCSVRLGRPEHTFFCAPAWIGLLETVCTPSPKR